MEVVVQARIIPDDGVSPEQGEEAADDDGGPEEEEDQRHEEDPVVVAQPAGGETVVDGQARDDEQGGDEGADPRRDHRAPPVLAHMHDCFGLACGEEVLENGRPVVVGGVSKDGSFRRY